MKRLLLLTFTIITANCFAQSNDQYVPPSRQQQPQSMQQPRWMSNSPGYELQKAGRFHFEGLGAEVAGVTLIIIGSAENQAAAATNGNSNTGAGGGAAAVGSILIVTGAVYQVLAWVHISRAGKLMDMHHVSMGPTQSGVGFAYNF